MGAWLRERSQGIIDGLLSAAVLAGAGVLYAKGIPWLVVALLVLGCGSGVLAAAHRLRGLRLAKRPVAVLTVATDFDRLALSTLMRPDPRLIDNVHRFTLARETFRIHGQDGVFEFSYEGTNVSARPSYCLRDTVAGDSPMGIRDLSIVAFDPVDSAPLAWHAILDEPYRKIIEIRFPRPVQPGESFRVTWSCTWCGTFTRRRDYVFFLYNIRRRGVDAFLGELVLSRPPAFVEGIRYDGRHLVTDASQPVVTTHEDGSCTVIWKMVDLCRNERYMHLIEFERTDRPAAFATGD
jgi:hypothetical protein